ncbi:ankyrin [Xylariaceae sp. FL0255]|nr:ankyrin [Xylariaceae sp. FL0255]
MAEYASAIIGLVAFGASVGNSLYGLIDTLKDAPNELLALSDEAQNSAEFVNNESLKDLQGAESRGRKILEDIDTLVQHVLKDNNSPSIVTKSDRLRWLRYSRKAVKLQTGLRAQKATITSFLATSILLSSARQGFRIQQLETKIDTVVKSQEPLLQIHNMIATQNAVLKGLQTTQQSTKTGSSASLVEPKRVPAAGNLELQLSSNRITTPLECFDDCPCGCHFKTIIRSPRYLSACLGDFFFGSSNLPWAFSGMAPCTDRSCRRSRRSVSEMKYFLPTWIGNAMAGLSISLNLRPVPVSVSIQARQIIPYDSPILVCTQEGDVDGVRKLLKSGKASLNDVDPYGLDLLYYAVYYGWRASGKEVATKMCRFLLDMGAHVEYEDEIGNTPMENMIDDTIVSVAVSSQTPRPVLLSDFFDISVLFDVPAIDLFSDLVGDRGFTLIHQILLGIRRDVSLEQYLSTSPAIGSEKFNIDKLDSCGRSALAWAVEYRWADATETLIRFGADPRQSRKSIHGDMPLLHLAIAGPPSEQPDDGLIRVVKTLLRAGADVNALDHEGWTALHVASSWNNYEVINTLAEHGGTHLAWDLLTNDGQSALDLSLGCGDDVMVLDLLRSHTTPTQGRIINDETSESDLESEEYVDCVDNLTQFLPCI